MKPRSFIKRLRHVLEAIGFFGLMGLFRLLGLERASNFGGRVARALGPHLPISNTARRNLRRSLPDLSAQDIETILRDMWDNLGRTFAEYAHLDRFDAYRSGGHIEVIGVQHFDAVKQRGRGAIFFSGHFANWEVLPLAPAGRGCAGGEVYRAANNPYVDRWITRLRRTYIYPQQIPKGAEGAKALIRLLKNKSYIAMLVDQKMNNGIAVPLFGRPAMTAPAAAQFALRFGCDLVPVSIRRLDGPNFRITVHPPLEVRPSGERRADVPAIMQQINHWLEERIRECPSQWLWLHNRWPKE